MRSRITFLLISFITISYTLSANNVQVTNVASDGTSTVTFDISWENSWKAGSTKDAVWIVLKGKPNGSGSVHLNISSVDPGNGYGALISDDDLGFFLEVGSSPFYGNVSTSVSVNYTSAVPASYFDVNVLAIEMVYVYSSPFYAGDGTGNKSYNKGNENNRPVLVNHLMTRGTTANDFKGGPSGHTGDIPVSFPKGRDNIYCMKYPVTESQFVDFLNSIPRHAQDFHTNSDLSGTTVTNRFVMAGSASNAGGSAIRCDYEIGTGDITFYCDADADGMPNESTDGLGRASRRLKIQNYYAYLDWIGLAPMTNLEYEKVCRGPLQPVPGEFAWGSTLTNAGGTIVNEGSPSEKLSNSGSVGGIIDPVDKTLRVGCHAPSSGATRELANASYYGVHGLTSRYVTPVIPPTDVDMYDGQIGDGALDINGRADFMDDNHVIMQKHYGGNQGTGSVSDYNLIIYSDFFSSDYVIQGVRRI